MPDFDFIFKGLNCNIPCTGILLLPIVLLNLTDLLRRQARLLNPGIIKFNRHFSLNLLLLTLFFFFELSNKKTKAFGFCICITVFLTEIQIIPQPLPAISILRRSELTVNQQTAIFFLKRFRDFKHDIRS